MSYFDRSDAEGLDLGDNEPECIHGVDLFAPCAKCKPMAADGGEGDDMQDPDKMLEHKKDYGFDGFALPIDDYAPHALVSMRNAIDANLKRRREELKKELEATEHALNGTRPRATRRDKGTTRAKENAA